MSPAFGALGSAWTRSAATRKVITFLMDDGAAKTDDAAKTDGADAAPPAAVTAVTAPQPAGVIGRRSRLLLLEC